MRLNLPNAIRLACLNRFAVSTARRFLRVTARMAVTTGRDQGEAPRPRSAVTCALDAGSAEQVTGAATPSPSPTRSLKLFPLLYRRGRLALARGTTRSWC
jgi:hypothetical protein